MRKTTVARKAEPFLKWAGGKTQLLRHLKKYIPQEYGKYIEPFMGGAAFFYHVCPERAVLADLNEELVNCYAVVRDAVESLIVALKGYVNDEEFYYSVRETDPSGLEPVIRAARTIYLNKTCYNGLYRVNKAGHFNVPFGRRRNPRICDEDQLRSASEALQGVVLVHGDYRSVLKEHACPGDFVYLDPPYYPAGGYADFKRYTKDFFYPQDHGLLAEEFARLVDLGCSVLLTNSNVPEIRDLYASHEYEIVSARRNISCSAATRTGEDLIVIGPSVTSPSPDTRTRLHGKLLEHFPGTRYMGSKERVLPFIWRCLQGVRFESVLDAFSGSGCVSYMFKQYGLKVVSNDFLHFAYRFAHATIENHGVYISDDDLAMLLAPNPQASTFIADTFQGLYFSDEENRFLDSLRSNIERLTDPYKKSLALSAISRACLKRRARGIFTYTGYRYDDGRRDLQIPLQEHFIGNIRQFNAAVFDNGKQNLALNSDVFDIDTSADLVYLDPPYFTPNSDNDYSRRYHFVEGLVRGWEGLELQPETKTRKFKRYETPFLSRQTTYSAFDRLFARFRDSILVVSYSSNGLPDKSELASMLKNYKQHVHVYHTELMYSFGNQGAKVGDNANRAQEFVFVAY